VNRGRWLPGCLHGQGRGTSWGSPPALIATLLTSSTADVLGPALDLMATVSSGLPRTGHGRYWAASFRSVMSRRIAEAPTIVPAGLRIGDMVNETGTIVPSFRRRVVSRRSTG
jgi:hypothetical protein